MSVVFTAFAQAGLIDAAVITIEPVIVGQGIPLCAPAPLDLRLQLLDATRVRDEIVQLHHCVQK